jgi:hypothetical protein
MGFAQLYYTSCESGLSDFAGFQFNAATPGLPAQVLREVEALTSYEPPRSLGYHPSPAEIAACPVNLVYACEPTTVLANVVFTGMDFSQRLGNYFAHALVGQTGTDRFDGAGGLDAILPIELWGSTVWAGRPITGGELPALTGLPGLLEPAAGRRMTRAGVDAFLADRARPEQLAALVTAAQQAVLGPGRSIVIIEADNSAAAHWIGAISFLLPSAVARRMSFATYRHRPEYSDAHVIATLPESDFDLGEAAFHSYVVFDAASGRISEVAPDPAATLLVRAGAVGAARLWQHAAELAGGRLGQATGITLADWHPALVAAAIRDGAPVTVTDLDALATWLGSSPAVLPEAALPEGARPEAALPEAALRACGERVLGPELVRAGGGPVLATLAGSRMLLDGALAHLAAVTAADPEVAVEIFAAGLGDLVPDDARLPGELRRAALLARARRDPGSRVPALGRLTEPNHPVEEGLLLRLWPEGNWTAAEARAALDVLGPARSADPPVLDWLARAIIEPAREPGYLEAYLGLCRAVEEGVAGRLPPDAERAVSQTLATVRQLDRAGAEPGDRAALVRSWVESYPEQARTSQDLIREVLPAQLDELAGSPDLPGLLAGCPAPLVAAYLETAHRRLDTAPADVDGTARLYQAGQNLRRGKDQVVAPALNDALHQGLRTWSPDELDRLQERLRTAEPELAAGFEAWRRRHLGGALRRSLRRLGQRAEQRAEQRVDRGRP